MGATDGCNANGDAQPPRESSQGTQRQRWTEEPNEEGRLFVWYLRQPNADGAMLAGEDNSHLHFARVKA